MVSKAGWSQEFFSRLTCIKIRDMSKNSCDQPAFETTNFSEEVLNLKDLEHILSRIWCKFCDNWDGSC